MEMTRSDRLHSALVTAIERYEPGAVVETGTYLGMGSTRALLAALGDRTALPFYTIEISRAHHELARENLADAPQVTTLWGLSVPREDALRFVREDPDVKPEHRDFYLGELRGAFGGLALADDAPDDLLAPLLERHRDDCPLVLLDSAGGIGWLEFRTLLRVMGARPFVLLMDDVMDVKHARSLRHVRESADFVGIDCFERHGWYLGAHRAEERARHPLAAAGAGGAPWAS